MATIQEERLIAIHLLRAGHSRREVAEQLGRTTRWVRKWWHRYEMEGWSGLADRSRAPKEHGKRIVDEVRRMIIQTRSELEAEAKLGQGLKYIGGPAVRTRLKEKRVKPLPSLSTIERVLSQAEMTRAWSTETEPKINYPHLQPTQPHQLYQVDIVPHYLRGGERVACFNGLDVVSRYPTGQSYARRRSREAATFLLHTWQTMGIPAYTQVDNEACFSGGFTHQYVLGKVVRLALTVGTELLFSPVEYPESNGYVERFHQEYNRHVWQDTYLPNRQAVQQQADHFFELYRHSLYHSALPDKSPHELHHSGPPTRLDPTFTLCEQKLPLRQGRIHFIRRVQSAGTVSVLNANWSVPKPDPDQGVWVTIEFQPAAATLTIYDAAPDVIERICLATYPFPLSEPVLSHQQNQTASSQTPSLPQPPLLHPEPEPGSLLTRISTSPILMSKHLLRMPLSLTTRWAYRLLGGTIY
jgi:transposase